MPIQTPNIVFRIVKGESLSFDEGDSNFRNLRDSLVQLSVEVDNNKSSSDSSITSVNNRVLGVEGSVSALQTQSNSNTSAIQIVSQRTTVLETTAGDHDTRLDALETTSVDHETRLDALETSQTNYEPRIDALETTSADHETRIYAVELELVTVANELDSDIITVNGRIDTLETNTNNSLLDHENRLDSAETILSSHGSRISNIELNFTSPFIYRGNVSGGTQSSPLDLMTLTYTAPGNFYRVSSSGYFIDINSVVHYLNATDSFVFLEDGISKFDNSDTVLSSNNSTYISLTGNPDEGYVIDLAQTTKDSIDSISDIATDVGDLQTTTSGHTTDIGNLQTDVADHETRIGSLESASLLYATTASGRAPFTTTDPDQIVDSFDSTVLKTAKYIAQAELADGSMHASEILVTNNGTTVYITEYAKLNGGTDLVTYSADFNGTLIELYATPVNVNTTITFARTAVKKV